MFDFWIDESVLEKKGSEGRDILVNPNTQYTKFTENSIKINLRSYLGKTEPKNETKASRYV